MPASHRILLVLASGFSLLACLLFLILPASSLIVDLVYQAF
jgi:hypothetical protein